MSWDTFESNIKRTRFDFSENQIQRLRVNFSEIYSILKYVFDSPRINRRVYTSLEDYRFKKEKLFQSPDLFYNFRFDDVHIFISCRRKSLYSVGVENYSFESICKKNEKFAFEHNFSCGIDFYGSFDRHHFSECVALFSLLVKTVMYDNEVPELSINNNLFEVS